MENVLDQDTLKVSNLLQVISHQTRLEIILALGADEACVCHLEAVLKQRQAYISQHLMALREAEIISARREGRYIFYSLEKPEILELVQHAMHLSGLSPEEVVAAQTIAAQGCSCPKCAPSTDDGETQTCRSQNS